MGAKNKDEDAAELVPRHERARRVERYHLLDAIPDPKRSS
jgi:hypothetical protein